MLASIRQKVAAGARLTPAEGEWLLTSAPLTALGEMAAAERFRRHPAREVTYVIDSNPNYTNVCNVDCVFCAFYRHAEDTNEVHNKRGDGVDRPEPSDGDGGNVLDEADRAALFAAAGERNPKTASLVGLLLLDGVKLGEALCADAGHFSDPPGALNVKRRGRVQRVPVCAATVAAIHSYLAARTTGPLFLSDTRGREDQRLTRSGAHYLLKQAGAAAGMSRPVSANTLRRSYVTDAHDAGVAVEDIQASVGHYDRRTTLRLLPDDTHVEHDEP